MVQKDLKEPVDNRSKSEMKLNSTKCEVPFLVTNKKIFQELEAHQLKMSEKKAQLH